MNYSDKKVMIGLSGGINSMAVLCWLANYELKPKELHLFYAHFEEHSPGTLEFVLAGVEYAKKHFDKVVYAQTNNSVLDYFREQKMIPHPTAAPCTRFLKIEPMVTYAFENGITVDLVGYVRTEKRRVKNMQSKGADNLFMSKQFPILQEDNEWCFSTVENEIGFYPAIYDLKWNDQKFIQFVTDNLHRFGEVAQDSLKKKFGKDKRVFTHNNCLPCKNMQLDDLLAVEYFYPEHFENAMRLSTDLKKYWGRSEKDFYTTFGRPDLGLDKQPCEVCAFD
jgi:3'-phosphoadenosine 5'-phosphosulfate sulfotransferase (PAPS reductase)/FAD synthetase